MVPTGPPSPMSYAAPAVSAVLAVSVVLGVDRGNSNGNAGESPTEKPSEKGDGSERVACGVNDAEGEATGSKFTALPS